jgi:hypothetical protein
MVAVRALGNLRTILIQRISLINLFEALHIEENSEIQMKSFHPGSFIEWQSPAYSVRRTRLGIGLIAAATAVLLVGVNTIQLDF